jgi:N utilization substance protein A
MIQKIRADERDSIYSEFVQRKGQLISGSVVRYEGGTLIVNLDHWTGGIHAQGRADHGTDPPPGGAHSLPDSRREGDRHQVKIILSRTHPDFIRRLFESEVPEIAENIIEAGPWPGKQATAARLP